MVVWNANGGKAAEPTPIGLYNGTITSTINFEFGIPYGMGSWKWKNWNFSMTARVTNGVLGGTSNVNTNGSSGGSGSSWPSSETTGQAAPTSGSIVWSGHNRNMESVENAVYFKVVDGEAVEITKEEYMELPENKENPS